MKNPSYWNKHVEFVRTYQKVGEFWLPSKDQTNVEMKIFGDKVLTIDHGEYAINDGLQPEGQVQSGKSNGEASGLDSLMHTAPQVMLRTKSWNRAKRIAPKPWKRLERLFNVIAQRTVPGSSLQITVTRSKEAVLAFLKGRLDIDSSPVLRDQLLSILAQEPCRAVVIDLMEVSYVDLSGVATLIEARTIARSQHSTLHLRGLQGRLLHLLEVTGVLSLFDAGSGASAQPESRVF